MKPIITVVIPVYNCERYVARVIKSVLGQPCGDRAEILVVDDGSTDKSGEVCDRIASENSNVYVIHKENGGVSTARNLGIEKATGEYIAFLDSDDWWEPGFLNQMQIEEFANREADVYEFSFRNVDTYIKLEFIHEIKNEEHTYDTHGFGRYDWSSPNAFCYRRKFLLNYKLRYPLAKSGEDGPFVEMALFYANTFKQLNRVMFSYWENVESCVHTTGKIRAIEESYRALLQERTYFQERGVEFDADNGMVWMSITSLPKLCAQYSFAEVRSFMEQGCERILAGRPDICYGKATWGKLQAWRRNPHVFFVKYKICIGIPLTVKRICFSTYGIKRIANYVYNRVHRKMHPIKNK